MAETMANGRDRLEKLFSRRKASRVRDSFVAGRSHIRIQSELTASPDIPVFPQPSFIRPKASRMLARDEVMHKSKPSRRTRSLAEPPSPSHEVSSTSDRAKPSVGSISNSPYGTESPYSLRQRRDPSLSALNHFDFAKRKDNSPCSSAPVSPQEAVLRRYSSEVRSPPRISSMPPRLDTPPPSDQDEIPSMTLPDVTKRPLPVPPPNEPTPAPSPELAPVSATRSRLPRITGPDKTTRHMSFEFRPRTTPIATPLRKTASDSKLAEQAVDFDPVLREPTFVDFLSLSDDDIAEEAPATSPSLPPDLPVEPVTPPAPQTPSRYAICLDSRGPITPPATSKGKRVLTLSPPLATRPATAAAFEAARIAARYQFDLVYVVNLWPSHMASSCSPEKQTPPSSVSYSHLDSHSSSHSLQNPVAKDGFPDGEGAVVACINPRSRMTGRLLAAYGLRSVVSPFRISAPVHQKILRTEGWIEYRCENPAPDEFARGYGCSFYTGHSPDGGDTPAASSSTATADMPSPKPKKRRARPQNRGIVFAAYRMPLADGTSLASDAAELDALRQDAETLVETLIDIHIAQRARKPGRRPSEEIPPLPLPVPIEMGALKT